MQSGPEGKADARIISGAAVATHRSHLVVSVCRVHALLLEQQRFKPPLTTSRWSFQ